MELVELLGSSPAVRSEVTLMAPDAATTTFAELWRQAREVSKALHRVSARRVAGMMFPTSRMISVCLGSMLAGRDFVSLPLRSRAQPWDDYLAQITNILRLSEADLLVLDGLAHSALSAAPPFPHVRYMSAEALFAAVTGGSPPDVAPGGLVQFSSGTTGVPKGVVLSGAALGSCISATLDATTLNAADVVCQWVPLSHDMGLVGGLFATWAAASRGASAGVSTKYICMQPETFLGRPRRWLELCSAEGATVVTAPAFAYHVLARHLQIGEQLDLSRLRACFVGAEPIAPETLESFCSAAHRHGFNPLSLCPGYGLAEATLLVSVMQPGEGWRTHNLTVDGRRREFVDCGGVLPCIEVDANTEPGRMRIRGAALCSEIIPSRPSSSDGWLDTGDLGVKQGNQLIPVGRSDDMLCLAGRNIFAWELERAITDSPGVRPGNAAVVPDGRGSYTLFFEPATEASSSFEEVCRELKRKLASLAGLGPSGIGCLPRGTLPKTPSGKLRRKEIERRASEFIDGSTSFQRY